MTRNPPASDYITKSNDDQNKNKLLSICVINIVLDTSLVFSNLILKTVHEENSNMILISQRNQFREIKYLAQANCLRSHSLIGGKASIDSCAILCLSVSNFQKFLFYCGKISILTPFKVYNSMALCIFTMLHNYHRHLSPEHFHLPHLKLHKPLNTNSPFFPAPSSWQLSFSFQFP